MNIMVGLGNPGEEFGRTYHNAGALALKEIIRGEGQAIKGKEKKNTFKKYKNLFEYAEYGDAVFVLPLTYMNGSGKAVREAMKKFDPQSFSRQADPPSGNGPHASFSSLVIFHDDSDLTLGKFKVSFGKNSGGHKGVQSTIDAIGSNQFWRVRIGVRPAREAKRKKAGEFALKQITPRDLATLAKVFEALKTSYPAVIPDK